MLCTPSGSTELNISSKKRMLTDENLIFINFITATKTAKSTFFISPVERVCGDISSPRWNIWALNSSLKTTLYGKCKDRSVLRISLFNEGSMDLIASCLTPFSLRTSSRVFIQPCFSSNIAFSWLNSDRSSFAWLRSFLIELASSLFLAVLRLFNFSFRVFIPFSILLPLEKRSFLVSAILFWTFLADS